MKDVVDKTHLRHSSRYSHEGVALADCIIESEHYPAISVPPEYEEIDIGDEFPVRVLKVGLWLLEKDSVRFAVLLAPNQPSSLLPVVNGIDLDTDIYPHARRHWSFVDV